jgi:hypothetical protein
MWQKFFFVEMTTQKPSLLDAERAFLFNFKNKDLYTTENKSFQFPHPTNKQLWNNIFSPQLK